MTIGEEIMSRTTRSKVYKKSSYKIPSKFKTKIRRFRRRKEKEAIRRRKEAPLFKKDYDFQYELEIW